MKGCGHALEIRAPTTWAKEKNDEKGSCCWELRTANKIGAGDGSGYRLNGNPGRWAGVDRDPYLIKAGCSISLTWMAVGVVVWEKRKEE